MKEGSVQVANAVAAKMLTETSDPDAIGRIKAPPVCVDTTLAKTAMSTEMLQQWLFPEDIKLAENPVVTSEHTIIAAPPTRIPGSNCSLASIGTAGTPVPPRTLVTTSVPVSVVSVSSNNSCGDSHTALSSDESGEHKNKPKPAILDKGTSDHINSKVATRRISRQGRSTQRWVNAPSGLSPSCGESVATASFDPLMRLVTGCVPILKSGKILFVSSSRKPLWILPKGGWEQDESMAESAIRECFEESGCLGTLGPALSPVQYETRKSKKRRLEQQNLPTPKSATGTTEAAGASPEVVQTASGKSTNETPIASNTNPSAVAVEGMDLSNEAISRIRQLSGHPTDETQSVASTLSTTYSHVQMTLFPLYVHTIESEWPEKGRFRRAVDIDEAIDMLENRPELKAVLQEVKDLGLHLLPNCDS